MRVAPKAFSRASNVNTSKLSGAPALSSFRGGIIGERHQIALRATRRRDARPWPKHVGLMQSAWAAGKCCIGGQLSDMQNEGLWSDLRRQDQHEPCHNMVAWSRGIGILLCAALAAAKTLLSSQASFGQGYSRMSVLAMAR